MLSIESLKTIWLLLTFSLLPITALYLIYLQRLRKILIEKYSEKFRGLDEVSLIKNNSISSSGKVIKFLLKKEFKEKNDPEIIRLGNTCRALLIAGTVLFICAFILPIIIGKMST